MNWNPAESLPPEFHQVAQRVYEDDPGWIPESYPGLASSFSRENPWFEHGAAWLGLEPGLCRLAGFFDPRTRIDGRTVAYFGFWETLDPFGINRRLFAELTAWARAQGAELLAGPVNFTTYSKYRLRLAGNGNCNGNGFLNEPYNPPYYEVLLEELGFSRLKTYVTQVARERSFLKAFVHQSRPLVEKLEGEGFRFVGVSEEYWMNNLEKLHRTAERVFGDNPGYTPTSLEEFRRERGASFAARICPYSSVLALGPEGEPAGFLICLPDYAPLARQGNPQRVDVAELSFEAHFPLLERPTLNVNTGGVLPEYRGGGLFKAIMAEVTLRGLLHYHAIGASVMHRGNLTRIVSRKPEVETREYGLFAKAV